jgi:hypothetical protein
MNFRYGRWLSPLHWPAAASKAGVEARVRWSRVLVLELHSGAAVVAAQDVGSAFQVALRRGPVELKRNHDGSSAVVGETAYGVTVRVLRCANYCCLRTRTIRRNSTGS